MGNELKTQLNRTNPTKEESILPIGTIKEHYSRNRGKYLTGIVIGTVFSVLNLSAGTFPVYAMLKGGYTKQETEKKLEDVWNFDNERVNKAIHLSFKPGRELGYFVLKYVDKQED